MMNIGFCYGRRRTGDLWTGSDRFGTRRLDWALPWVDTAGVRIHGVCPSTVRGRTSADGCWRGYWHSHDWTNRNCRHPPPGRPYGSTGAQCYWASLVSRIEDPGRKAKKEPLNAGHATRGPRCRGCALASDYGRARGARRDHRLDGGVEPTATPSRPGHAQSLSVLRNA